MLLALMGLPLKTMETSLWYLLISVTNSWAGRMWSPWGLMTFVFADTMMFASFPH